MRLLQYLTCYSTLKQPVVHAKGLAPETIRNWYREEEGKC